MKYYMGFIALLGIFEMASNTLHLSKGSIGKIGRSAKRQHREMPLDIGDVHFFIKAIIMLAFGLSFLASGVFYFLDNSPYPLFRTVTLVLFGAYGLIQAAVYRRPVNVWLSAAAYNLPLLAYFIIRN